MRRRIISHICAASLLWVTALGINWQPHVLAAPTPTASSHPTPAPVALAPRDDTSTRLPEPIMWGSPLASPLPAAIPWGSPLPSPIPSFAALAPAPKWPVAGVISQGFSAGHPAIDIAAPYGSPIVSPVAGIVTLAGWANNGGGYQVHIDSGDGVTGLHHMSSVAASAGQWVAAGQVVGYVGCTGTCTGPHVHWTLWNGGWRNPLP